MAVGILVTKSEIDSRMGQLAQNYQKLFRDLAILKVYFDATPNNDLAPIGFSPAEVTIMKAAIADLNQLYDIARGAATLTIAKDFQANVRQMWGVGVQ